MSEMNFSTGSILLAILIFWVLCSQIYSSVKNKTVKQDLLAGACMLFSGLAYYAYFQYLALPLKAEAIVNFVYFKRIMFCLFVLIGLNRLLGKSENAVLVRIKSFLSWIDAIVIGALLAAVYVGLTNLDIRWNAAFG